MITRCPACAKPVADADAVCPHCGRDFSAPAARKAPPPPAKPAAALKPKFQLEPADDAAVEDAPPPAKEPEADRDEKPADRPKVGLVLEAAAPAEEAPAQYKPVLKTAPPPEEGKPEAPAKAKPVLEALPSPEAAEPPKPVPTPDVEAAPAAKKEKPAAKPPRGSELLLDRCPGCGKPVAEADETCPHCGRSFAAPIVRKPAPKEPPPKEPPKSLKEERPAAAKAARPVLDQEDAPPAARSEELVPTPSLRGGPGIDNPPAFVSSYSPAHADPYTVVQKPARPAWHWVVLAALCGGAALKFTSHPPAPPNAPSAPGTPPAIVKPLDDAKAAAAAAAAAAQVPAAATPANPQPAPLTPPAAAPVAALPAPPAPEPPKPVAQKPPPKQKPRRIARRPAEEVDEDRAALAASPAPYEQPAPRRSGDMSEWRMRGFIRDLVSGEPIANADVVFMDFKSAKPYRTTTRPDGHYGAALPVNDEGYDLTIRHSKYEPKFFEDSSPPYRKLGFEERQRAVKELLNILQTKEPLRSEGGAVIERDFVLIPLTR